MAAEIAPAVYIPLSTIIGKNTIKKNMMDIAVGERIRFEEFFTTSGLRTTIEVDVFNLKLPPNTFGELRCW